MYVNPFWFGFLMAIVTIIFLIIVLAVIRSHREEDEEEPTPEEFRNILEEMTGKKYKVSEKDGYLVGEQVEEEEKNESENQ